MEKYTPQANSVTKFLFFIWNRSGEDLLPAFAAAAKAQDLNKSYFYSQYLYENRERKQSNEEAITAVYARMAIVSQNAFVQWIEDNYKAPNCY